MDKSVLNMNQLFDYEQTLAAPLLEQYEYP